jgi:hypothetical protein
MRSTRIGETEATKDASVYAWYLSGVGFSGAVHG